MSDLGKEPDLGLGAAATLGERGLPSVADEGESAIGSRPAGGASVCGGDLILPAMVLKESAVANNLEVMADYGAEHGFLLAPHGKTTMSPALFRRQLDQGAWGITVANVAQAAVARLANPERILIANEVVGRADIAQLGSWLSADGPEIFCLADSAAGVELLERGLSEANALRPLSVLVEVGWQGGRSGVRSEDDAIDVASAVGSARHLRLAGVEGYEGVVGSDRSASTLAKVDAFLETLRQVSLTLARSGVFDRTPAPIVSAGGSKYFDRVAQVLVRKDWPAQSPEVVVRSGCYLTHDDGHYAEVSPLSRADSSGRHLLPALEIWAEVLSCPEPGRIIVGMGKRDVSFDLGYPLPLHWARGSDEPMPAPDGLSVVGLDDQHAYLQLSAGDPLGVGDRLGFGLSHPCTAFDKWRLIPLVDDHYRVIDVIRTFF